MFVSNLRRDLVLVSFFFFNDTATTEIYTLSLHDALPIYARGVADALIHQLNETRDDGERAVDIVDDAGVNLDRKSTRLNSSHGYISYAVFCLKKKKKRIAARQSLE